MCTEFSHEFLINKLLAEVCRHDRCIVRVLQENIHERKREPFKSVVTAGHCPTLALFFSQSSFSQGGFTVSKQVLNKSSNFSGKCGNKQIQKQNLTFRNEKKNTINLN